MKLLIHHHAPAFVDAQGIHVQSFIGNWVKAMSPLVAEIGLLLPLAKTRSDVQDTLISESNIQLHALPVGGNRWAYFERKKQIQTVCQAVSREYDVLLVRGLTPRQWTVWQNCQTPKKAFLLVGSLLENRPKFGWNADDFLTWVLSHLRRWEFKQISADEILLANSPHLVQEIKTYCHQKAQFASTNTLQKDQIRPLNLKEIGHPCRLLFCGRVVQDKGIEELIEALGLLNKEHERGFRLTIVGSATPTYKSRLEVLARQYGVEADIDWEGFVPFGEQLLAHYRKADLMVLPSWHEGFPHNIWEAAICSLPVLSTKVGGIPGLLDDSKVQFIEKKSAKDIASKVSFLLNNKALRWEKVERLYDFAQGFTVEMGAKALVDKIGVLSKN